MRVLLVEDNIAVANCVETMLKSEGYDCDWAQFTETGLDIGTLRDYDLIIAGHLLPDLGGYEFLRRLLNALVDTPVLIISDLPRPDQRLESLGIEADNYLAKPFDKDTLLARMRTAVLRSEGPAQSIISTGKLTLNLRRRAVEVSHQPLSLTAKEYEITEFLMLNKGKVVTKQMILDKLYGGMNEPNIRVIDVFISKLRRKLTTASGGEEYIDTIWGRGYVVRDILFESVKTEDMARLRSTAA